MTDAKILMWDIELSPMKVYTWDLYPSFISTDKIIDTQRIICFGYRWYGEKTAHVVDERIGHPAMIQQLHDVLNEADFLVSWNGQRFDTRHANREFLQLGLTPPSPHKEIDLMRVAKARFKFASNKLDHVVQELGIGAKADTGGFQLWRDILEGDEATRAKAWKIMTKYQKQDVDLLVDAYEYLRPWIKMPHPVTDAAGLVCRNCGGTHFQRRGVAKTLNGSYPRYQCQGCGAWLRGNERTAVGDLRAI